MARPLPTTIQELPPRWAHLCLDVEAFVGKLLAPAGTHPEERPLKGKGLVLACSGGADSIALLHLLVCLKPRAGFNLVVAHLDHELRNDSSDDAKFVAARCADLRVPYAVEHVDVQAKAKRESRGIEDAGRQARYDFLERTRAEYGSDWILTAHHQDDLTEDVLMRLLRGTGWPGLAGMPAIDHERHLLRPLMMQKKAELQEFLTELNLSWREDSTNTQLNQLRNRVRHKILPLIREDNPSFSDSIGRLWAQGTQDADFWEQAVESAHVIHTERGPELRQVELLDMHPALRLRLYKKLLDELGPGQVLAQTLFDMDDAVVRKDVSRAQLYQFPGGKTVHFHGGRLMFRCEEDLGPEPIDPTRF